MSQERREIAARLAAAEARAGELAALLDAVVTPLGQATSEAQLPLHILLENHFGDLNENQEEMLQAASDATDRIDLAVRDDGRGLPDGFSFESATGLGLSIVRALVVSDLGGSISASSPTGSGTVVSLSVPLHGS